MVSTGIWAIVCCFIDEIEWFYSLLVTTTAKYVNVFVVLSWLYRRAGILCCSCLSVFRLFCCCWLSGSSSSELDSSDELDSRYEFDSSSNYVIFLVVVLMTYCFLLLGFNHFCHATLVGFIYLQMPHSINEMKGMLGKPISFELRNPRSSQSRHLSNLHSSNKFFWAPPLQTLSLKQLTE